MLSNGEVHASQSEQLDILSGLPDDVADDILVRLPLRDAVRTSILSKKWRYNWCRLTHLILDETLWDTTQDEISQQLRFTDIIYHLLVLRSKPISKFTLSINDLDICPKIDALICFLSRNGIQHLVLELPRCYIHKLPSSFFTCMLLRHVTLTYCSVPLPPPTFEGFDRLISLELHRVYCSSESLQSLISHSIQHLVLDLPLLKDSRKHKLPSSFFSCMLLRRLTLKHCSISLPPPTFKGFDRLISLELCCVIVSSKLLQSLISHSPFLEQLSLQYLRLSNVIEINAPMLRSFEFAGDIRYIWIKNISLLMKLSLEDIDFCYQGAAEKFDIASFFESFPALEDLHLDEESMKFLATRAGEVPTRHPFDLNRVKRLRLSGISLTDLDVVLCALFLLRSLPYLQYMEIQVGGNADDMSALKAAEVEAFSDFTFDHLREVKLESLGGTKSDVQLTKLLLAKSPVLVRMQICIDVPEDDELSTVMAEISTGMIAAVNSFERASSDVEVVYDYICD